MQAVFPAQPPHFTFVAGSLIGARIQTEAYVFGDGHGFKKREVLKDNADAEFARRLRAVDARGFAAPIDVAAVGLRRAVDDVDERAFSGAVFADERVFFTGAHDKMNVVVGAQIAVGFANAARFQQRRRHH